MILSAYRMNMPIPVELSNRLVKGENKSGPRIDHGACLQWMARWFHHPRENKPPLDYLCVHPAQDAIVRSPSLGDLLGANWYPTPPNTSLHPAGIHLAMVLGQSNLLTENLNKNKMQMKEPTVSFAWLYKPAPPPQINAYSFIFETHIVKEGL